MNKIQFLMPEVPKSYYPPVPLKKVIPDWYKNLSKYIVDKELATNPKYLMDNSYKEAQLTAKSCIPLRDYATSGYVIRAQADCMITQEFPDEDAKKEIIMNWWCVERNLLDINYHPNSQLPIEINGRKNNYIKFEHKIGIKTPAGYSCLFYQPELFFESRFRLIPGIVDTDTYHNPVSFTGYITSIEKSFKIEAGTPLMVVFPFKREKWESELVHVEKHIIPKFMIVDWYKKIFHSRKSYE